MKKNQESHRLQVFGKITPELMNDVIINIGKLVDAGVTEAELLINSKGGAISSALNIYDVIVASGIKFRGIVIADCLSSAVSILQACSTRHALPNSSFLIHGVSRKFEIEIGKQKTLEIFLSEMKDLYSQVASMSERNEKVLKSRISPEQEQAFDKLYSGGGYCYPEEVLEAGLIDGIVTSV